MQSSVNCEPQPEEKSVNRNIKNYRDYRIGRNSYYKNTEKFKEKHKHNGRNGKHEFGVAILL